MTASNSDESELGMTTHRIEALTDGIFAIAMTLLVLNLALPETGNGPELHKLLIGQTHKFFSYALSFLLLALYWVLHHRQFHFIHNRNPVYLELGLCHERTSSG